MRTIEDYYLFKGVLERILDVVLYSMDYYIMIFWIFGDDVLGAVHVFNIGSSRLPCYFPTEPISKAPYRMAPVELKELKEQLQEIRQHYGSINGQSNTKWPRPLRCGGEKFSEATRLLPTFMLRVFSRLALPPTQLMRKGYTETSKKGFGCVFDATMEGDRLPSRQLNPYEVLVLLGEYRIESNLMQQIKEAQYGRRAFREQKRHDAIWVVVDRLTKSAHFFTHVRRTRYLEVYKSHFWKGLHKALGKLRLN
ncbi:hypothetical protein Tco_0607677 [Tanacetum coccineum]